MDSIRIEGGKPLQGSVYIQGSKNAALPMMAAALLNEGTTVLNNCPRIADVACMEAILKHLGAKISWEGNRIEIDCSCILETCVPPEHANCMRSSVVLMGSMLGRMGRISISYPGGCTIGKRPIDIHMQVLKQMGVYIREQEGVLEAHADKIKCCETTFPKVSVGATENAVLTAVAAEGTTVLHNCAVEPEITHLCGLLTAMGAEIEGIGTKTLRITGGRVLHDAEYTVPADRIVAGTYLYAGAITRGAVTLINPPLGELGAILAVYEKMGGQYQVNGGKLVTDSARISKPVPFIQTEIYPGFPTDMQSILMAVLATVEGKSTIREELFEDRFKVVSLLNQMGARIQLDSRDALIEGGAELKGCRVFAEELRGGAALILAGLAAEGTTVVENPHFIERGYEDICRVITALGGTIERKYR